MRYNNNTFQPNIESLEERTVLSLTWLWMVDGELKIQGSDSGAWSEVTETSDQIVVRDLDTGSEFSYAKSAVEKIVYFGGASSDYFSNKTTVASEIHGGGGDDVLTGGSGHDTIFGEFGNDTLFGGAGNDLMDGGIGNDSLHGQADNDRLIASADADYFVGGNGNDTYVFNTSQNLGSTNIGLPNTGDAGTDTLDFSGSSMGINLDMSHLGAWQWVNQNASLKLYNELEHAIGTSHGDTIRANSLINKIWGGDGADTLYGAGGYNELNGEAGNDTLVAGPGFDYLYGGKGDNTYALDTSKDLYAVVIGKENDDSGNDSLDFTGSTSGITLDLSKLVQWQTVNGNLQIWFNTEVENVIGTVYADTIFGNSKSNTIWGSFGNDYIKGGSGKDWLYGQGGEDALFGQKGKDKLFGGADNDQLLGGGGKDKMYGDEGIDTIDGKKESYWIKRLLYTKGFLRR